jgi:hypothetical protein
MCAALVLVFELTKFNHFGMMRSRYTFMTSRFRVIVTMKGLMEVQGTPYDSVHGSCYTTTASMLNNIYFMPNSFMQINFIPC